MLSVYPKSVLFGTDLPPVLSQFICKFYGELGYCAFFKSLTVRANASCLLASKQRPGQPWCEGGNLEGERETQALKEQTVPIHDVNT